MVGRFANLRSDLKHKPSKKVVQPAAWGPAGIPLERRDTTIPVSTGGALRAFTYAEVPPANLDIGPGARAPQ